MCRCFGGEVSCEENSHFGIRAFAETDLRKRGYALTLSLPHPHPHHHVIKSQCCTIDSDAALYAAPYRDVLDVSHLTRVLQSFLSLFCSFVVSIRMSLKHLKHKFAPTREKKKAFCNSFMNFNFLVSSLVFFWFATFCTKRTKSV